ncbi:hypothetical protein, partial [Shouchella clausii]|uniref:hypothetical protein n=1 Tax=Shouchella clausii TaxID=79880 RepID=UPI001C3EA361
MREQHRFTGNLSLQHLEKFYDTRPTSVYEKNPSLTIFQAANRRSEVEGIARKIHTLIRQGS